MTKTVKTDVILIDGVLHEKRPDGSFAPITGVSDWARVDAMSDEELATIAALDPDSVEFREEDWAEAADERRHRRAVSGPGKLKLR